MPPPMLGTGNASSSTAPGLVAIGSSTGGPSALMQILGAFSEAPPYAVLVAQHMPAGFTSGFAERLDRLTPFTAREAAGGEDLVPGHLLIAPGGRHLELESVAGRIRTRIHEHTAADTYSPSSTATCRSWTG